MGGEEAGIPGPGTDNPEAYTLCLKGRHYASGRTPEGLQRAIGCFEQAVGLDPGYAVAWAELGGCHALRGFDEFADLPPRETMPRAKATVQQALALDPSLGEAHAWMGVIALLYEWDWARAEQELVRALVLNPQYPLAHIWHGILLAARVATTASERHPALWLTRFPGEPDRGAALLGAAPYTRRRRSSGARICRYHSATSEADLRCRPTRGAETPDSGATGRHQTCSDVGIPTASG
jgi:tetratricopeptide (TPR) repeat protein